MSLYRSVRAYMDEQKLFDSVNKLIELSFSAYESYVNSLKELLISEESLPRLRQKVARLKFHPDFIQALGEGNHYGLRNAFVVGAQQIYKALGISRVIALKDGFDFDWELYDQRVRSWMRLQAFSIAGVENLYILSGVQSELTQAIESGITFNDWRDWVDSLFDRMGVTRLGRHHLYTVYQTNLHGAYNAGRFYAMNDPEVAEEFPAWEYVAVMDGKTRPSHAEMNGKIFPRDDPIWREWYPPNGFNCRCLVVPVHRSEAAHSTRWRPVQGPDPGFESNPALTTHIFERWVNSSLSQRDLRLDEVPSLYPVPGIKRVRAVPMDKNEILDIAEIRTFENEVLRVGAGVMDATRVTLQNPAEVWGWLENGNAQRLFIRPMIIEGKRKYGVALVENLQLKDFQLSGLPPARKGFLLFTE